MAKRLTVGERREIFRTLVLLQDEGHDVSESRQLVTKQFRITEHALKQIEEEGIEREWPPLAEEESRVKALGA
jgi:hypothetical protein